MAFTVDALDAHTCATSSGRYIPAHKEPNSAHQVGRQVPQLSLESMVRGWVRPKRRRRRRRQWDWRLGQREPRERQQVPR